METTYDVAVVGAGPAGLQAALTLGRMRQRVIVFGTDRHRNDPADAMHNFLGHDGEDPAELRAAARKDVEQYDTVAFRDAAVDEIREDREADGFRLRHGGDETLARRVILATGVVDDLPEVPGLAELFGGPVAHCPYCHGHEYADTPVGLLGTGPHLAMMARVMEPIASSVTVFTDGAELPVDLAEALAQDGREVVATPIARASGRGAGVVLHLADGEEVELGGMLVKTDWRLAAPFAEQLGLELSEVGAVVVDVMGRTSLPGVYAAGDMAQGPGLGMPMASVLTAASTGLLAAAGCHQDTLMGS